MEENVLSSRPTFKIYKDRAIYVGTFVGGPLVAGYLAAENFKQLGQPDNIKTTWIIAIASTIIIFGCIYFVPGIEKVPNIVIPLIYTGIAQLLVQKFQGASIRLHIETGGETYSTWRAVWIGLIGLGITFTILFFILLITGN